MRDSLRARIRLERLFSAVDWRATALPERAILCIRKVPDPLPGSLSLAADLQPSAEWQQALTSMLNRFSSEAVRPFTNPVAPGANAVLFLDEAELMASLAADWCRGSLTTNWWWQSFLRKGRVPEIVIQRWREVPEYVPAALQHLSKQHLAATFVAKLSEGDVHQIVGSLARSFGLQALQRTVETRLPGLSSTTELDFGSANARSDNNALDAVTRAPWVNRVPEAESRQLSSEQQRFLGIALTIQRAPAQARSRTFAQAVERWQEAVARRVQNEQDDRDRVKAIALTHAGAPVESHPKDSSDARKVSPIQFEQNTVRERARVPVQLAVIHDAEERQAQTKSFPEEFSSKTTASDRLPHDSIGTKILLPTFDPVRDLTEVRESERDLFSLEHQDLFASVSLDDSVAAASVEIASQLGGLFYLINVGLYLNLYGDFTMPAEPGIELSPWDFVALVGAELVGDSLEEDPIWSLLTNLAGRGSEEPPGSSFAPDDEWRLPPEWLAMFSDDRPWRWSTLGTRASRPAKHARGVRTQARLRVLHPEGFLILDLPLAKDVHGQLQREIKPYDVSSRSLSREGIPKSSRLRSKVTASPKVRRWLSRLMPYVRARLCLALGLESHHDIATMLCRRYARVRATDTHLDVFFGLADLPLEIRFAGLDRDPGWVPAAGRFITFHFD